MSQSTFWLSLAAKLILAAGLVVTASIIAERVGALAGSLIATLPVSAGPAYILLATEQDAAFVAVAALISFAVNPATLILVAAYVLLSQRFGFLGSLAGSIGVWLVVAAVAQSFQWSILAAVLFNTVTFAAVLWIVRRHRTAPMPRVRRPWYDIPLRAALVVAANAGVLIASRTAGPTLSGAFAVFPVVFTSLLLILHPRVGAAATAAVLANGIFGLIGFAAALLALHYAAVPFGTPLALLFALLVAVAWNLLVLAMRRHLAV